jgi:hypothetical protein
LRVVLVSLGERELLRELVIEEVALGVTTVLLWGMERAGRDDVLTHIYTEFRMLIG